MIAIIAEGDLVDVIETVEDDNWALLRYGDIQGYLETKNLEEYSEIRIPE